MFVNGCIQCVQIINPFVYKGGVTCLSPYFFCNDLGKSHMCSMRVCVCSHSEPVGLFVDC